MGLRPCPRKPYLSMEVLTTGRTEAEAGLGNGGHAGVLLARDQVLADTGEGLGTEQPPTDLHQ